MIFTLERDVRTPEMTGGVILVPDSDLTWVTLELPWRGNRRGESCIPSGSYPVVIAASTRFGRLLPRVLNVPNRSGILFHPLNEVTETEGCIGVGMARSEDWRRLLNSKKAFGEFFTWLGRALKDGPALLEVRNR